MNNTYYKIIMIKVDDFSEAKIIIERHCKISEKNEMVQALRELYSDSQKYIIITQERNLIL